MHACTGIHLVQILQDVVTQGTCTSGIACGLSGYRVALLSSHHYLGGMPTHNFQDDCQVDMKGSVGESTIS